MNAESLAVRKLWPMFKVGQRTWSRLHIQNLWNNQKGLFIRNMLAKFESQVQKDIKKCGKNLTSEWNQNKCRVHMSQ